MNRNLLTFIQNLYRSLFLCPLTILDSHWKANNLYQVPYNLAILIILHSYGNGLPNNSAELYIYATICEILGSPDLCNLPDPTNRTIEQLSRLSFESIINKKLT